MSVGVNIIYRAYSPATGLTRKLITPRRCASERRNVNYKTSVSNDFESIFSLSFFIFYLRKYNRPDSTRDEYMRRALVGKRPEKQLSSLGDDEFWNNHVGRAIWGSTRRIRSHSCVIFFLFCFTIMNRGAECDVEKTRPGNGSVASVTYHSVGLRRYERTVPR